MTKSFNATIFDVSYAIADLDSDGWHAAAEPLHRLLLALIKWKLGENHPYFKTCRINLDYNLMRQGKHSEKEQADE